MKFSTESYRNFVIANIPIYETRHFVYETRRFVYEMKRFVYETPRFVYVMFAGKRYADKNYRAGKFSYFITGRRLF
jgi:hypothetical protein